jgi:hypothetical protein
VNGAKKSVKTNTRLSLPAGNYKVELKRDGYRDWQRNLSLAGGSVQHVDYPFLFPKTLESKKIQTYTAAPGLVTQSPDHHWLLVEKLGDIKAFDLYDLKAPDKPAEALTLPDNVLTKAAGAPESLQPSEWADDNRHVVLQHTYGDKKEFILLDRADPTQSVNLNNTLGLAPGKLTLRDKKFDSYYVYDGSTLQTASLKTPGAQPYLEHVLNYQSYGSNIMLYATNDKVPAGKVQIKLQNGDKTYVLRTFPAGTTYLMDLTKYSGDMYVTTGASSENKVYIYRDPIGQLDANPDRALVPAQILHVTAPNYLSFSASAQFIVTENATEFGVYDIEYKEAYHYVSPFTLDPPQIHAEWMDGNRLTYVSGGKLAVFDYDNSNRQLLVPAASQYKPVFTPDYKLLYTVALGTSGQFDLNQTYLLTPPDR